MHLRLKLLRVAKFKLPNMHILKKICVFCLMLPTFTLNAAFASNLHKAVASFSNWHVYIQVEDGQKVCFIASTPQEKVGNYKKRGTPYIWVRHISKNIDEVSITAGYQNKSGTYPELFLYKPAQAFQAVKDEIVSNAKSGNCKIKTEKNPYIFNVVDGQQSWVKDVDHDEEIIKNMISDNYAIVTARSQKETCSVDIYSLSGFTKAYNKMKELCK